ncbi:methionyl-tRNA formyltransferase [Thermodesulfobacteriota bacterium]
MKIIFWIKGNRGVSCLKKVIENGYTIDLLVLQAQAGKQWYQQANKLAQEYNIKTAEPEEPNSPETEKFLEKSNPDLFVLAGYGKILRQNIIKIPKIMCINLHGGKLPEYRGSSPMNWVLIRGQQSFGISIIKVDAGVDTGDVLLDRSFPIDENSNIRDLHAKADESFPEMLVEVLNMLKDGSYKLRSQDNEKASYFPLRFPEDGLIFWDMFTAEEIHNRIRALTQPYPCAYSYFKGRKVKLLSSVLRSQDFFGEPGRVYLKKEGKLLVCAKDKCLWIAEAVFEDTGDSIFGSISRYERFATVMAVAEQFYQ